jgi:nicotinamidase-related amidase
VDRDALLIMDVQQGIVDQFSEASDYLARLGGAVSAARDYDIPVLFIRVAFRPGYPEVSDRNRSFRALRERGDGGGPGLGDVHPDLHLAPDDIIITKKRVSAFAGSDLEVILRALDIRHLVLAGIATSGVVLSTVREAADQDYVLTVLEDGCLDRDPEVQRVLMEKVFVRQATVTSIASWMAGLVERG